jgi:hypothetical protein
MGAKEKTVTEVILSLRSIRECIGSLVSIQDHAQAVPCPAESLLADERGPKWGKKEKNSSDGKASSRCAQQVEKL